MIDQNQYYFVIRLFLFLLTLLALPAPVAADTIPTVVPQTGVAISAGPGHIIGMDRYARQWLKHQRTVALTAEVIHSTLASDSDAFAADYGYPLFSYGLKWNLNDVTMHRNGNWGQAQEVDYDSQLGNIITAYGTFSRPILRTRRWEVDYVLGTGLAWGRHKYSRGNNIDNELTGSRWLIYFVAGLQASYRVAPDWLVRGGVEFYHHSNGAINRPNKGANYLGPTLGVVYAPYDAPRACRAKVHEPFRRYNYLELTWGTGAKTLNEDWQKTQFRTPLGDPSYRTGRFHVYPTLALRTAFMRRYARRWASGLGVDVFYGSYADDVARLDEADGYDERHSRWSVGVSAKHTAFYHRLSVSTLLGYYLYRHMGHDAQEVEKPYYEQVGLAYSFPSLGGLTVGFSIKAHLTKADYTELLLSMPFRLGRRMKE